MTELEFIEDIFDHIICFTVIFTEVDFYSMVKIFPNIEIKRHEMAVTDWLCISEGMSEYICISFAYQHDVWNTSG